MAFDRLLRKLKDANWHKKLYERMDEVKGNSELEIAVRRHHIRRKAEREIEEKARRILEEAKDQ